MFKVPGGLFPRLIAFFPLLFPLYFFRGTLLGVPVSLPELVLGILFVLFLLQGYEFRLRDWKLWPVLLFLLAAGLSIAVVFVGDGSGELPRMVDGTEFPAKMKALGILKGWIVAPVLYFVMARTIFREKPSMMFWALRALVLSGAVLSVLALVQVVTGDFLTPDMRASGPFESANYLALYLGPLVVFAGLAAVESDSKGDRIFLGICAVLGAAALFFSKSYAGWIAVAGAGSLGLLLLARRRSRKSFWIAFAALFGLGLVLLLSQLGTDKFAQFVDFAGRSSSSVRLQIYEISTALIADHPLLGIGMGQFEQQYQEVAEVVLGSAPFEWNMLHPHNILLAFWLNMGLLGLGAFVWLCGRALLWLTERDKKERHLVALMLVTLLIHGLFDTPYFKNDLAFQFWLFMAMLL
ncbi:MAG: O-antigen ligase family protein [Candidatus Gracilibacteria bacterium]